MMTFHEERLKYRERQARNKRLLNQLAVRVVKEGKPSFGYHPSSLLQPYPTSELWYAEFHSVADLCQFEYSSSFGGSWTLGSHFKTSKDARDAILSGSAPANLWSKFQEAREGLEPQVAKFAGRGVSTRRRRVRREEGAELDLDRLAVGDPLCWESRVRGAKRRLVRLGFQFGQIGAAGEEEFARSAASCAAGADVLQKLGYAVEIVAVDWGNHFRKGILQVHSVKLKHSQQPMDAQAVLVMGIPAACRVHSFGVHEAFGLSPNDLTMHPLNERAKELAGVDYLMGQDWTQHSDGSIRFSDRFEGFLSSITERR